jgi:hypothetical protein
MRRKRVRQRPAAAPRDERPPDATGQTIDWMGVQSTAGGGCANEAGCLVVGLVALRAAPFVIWRVSRRLAAWRRSRRR